MFVVSLLGSINAVGLSGLDTSTADQLRGIMAEELTKAQGNDADARLATRGSIPRQLWNNYPQN